jgi:hypothetical protein
LQRELQQCYLSAVKLQEYDKLAACLALHPNLLFARVDDVSAGRDYRQRKFTRPLTPRLPFVCCLWR